MAGNGCWRDTTVAGMVADWDITVTGLNAGCDVAVAGDNEWLGMSLSLSVILISHGCPVDGVCAPRCRGAGRP